MANDTPNISRAERVLAYMIASAIGLAVVSFLAIIIGTAAGVTDFGAGLWPLVFVITPIALVFGFILLVVMLIMAGIRRGREAKDAGN